MGIKLNHFLVVLLYALAGSTVSAADLNLSTNPAFETINSKRYVFVKKDGSVAFSVSPSKSPVSLTWTFVNGDLGSKTGNGPHTIFYRTSALGKSSPVKFSSSRTDEEGNNCVTTNKTTCRVVVPQFELVINAFIAQDNIEHPLDSSILFGGDNRSWNKDGEARIKQKFTLISVTSVDSDGFLEGSEHKLCGETRSYDKAAPSLDSGGKLTATAKADTVKGKPLKIDWDTASTSGITIETPSKPATRKVKLKFDGSAGNPLATGPAIDYNLEIELDTTDPEKTTYKLTGTHDKFPSYEVYINEKRVYQHDESGHSPVDLFPWMPSQPVNKSGNLP